MVAFQTLWDSFPDAEEMDASHSWHEGRVATHAMTRWNKGE